MNDEVQVLFLENCGIYAYNNSIAVDEEAARVVSVNSLRSHLMESCPSTYAVIVQLYHSLEHFLKGPGRDIIRAGLITRWNEWNYELMTASNYYSDKRQEHEYFSELTQYVPDNMLLFVFYLKEDKRRYETERQELKKKSLQKKPLGQPRHDPVSNEIFDFCYTLEPTEQFFNNTKSLLRRIQAMLDHVWPGMNYRVAVFGSTANLLGLKDADVDLCVIVPETRFEQDLRIFKQRLTKQPKSVYNMFYLAARLKDMGMKHVEAIGGATVPICKFYDPQTGFSCDINTNNVLGIENTRMIGQYADLDTRIRPFLAAIKQFVKQKNINNPRGGTLSSYAYVIMALHFLMVGLDTPIIPSLQKLNARCQSRTCKSKTGKHVSLYHDHQIIRCDARYHDCVHIINSTTTEYTIQPSVGKNENITYWESKNKDTVSQILAKFFAYYSEPKNLVVSIIQDNGKLSGGYNIYQHWNGQHIVVQDPFIHSKNVARSCTTVGANAILQEFQRAARLSAEHVPFSTVCDKRYNISRPIDTECMEYRFQKQPQPIHGPRQNQRQQQQHHQHQQPDQVIGYLEEKSDKELVELITPFLIEEEENKEPVQTLPVPKEPVVEKKKPQQDEILARGMRIFAGQAAKEKAAAQKAAAATATAAVESNAGSSSTSITTCDSTSHTARTDSPPSSEASLAKSSSGSNSGAASTSTTTKPTSSNSTTASKTTSSQNNAAAKANSHSSSNGTTKANTNGTNIPQGPMINLVQKLMSLQSSIAGNGSFENLTSKPCTDMSKLLDDPCMTGVDMKDVCYLIAQLNYLGDSVADRVLSGGVSSHIDQDDMMYMKQLQELMLGGAIAPDDDEDENDEDEDAELDELIREELAVADSAEPEIPVGTVITSEQLLNMSPFKDKILARKKENERLAALYKEDDMVHVYFYVESVPTEIECYEIGSALSWWGAVKEISLEEEDEYAKTYLVKMKILYGKLQNRFWFPTEIELGDLLDVNTTCQLSIPCLTDPRLYYKY